MFRLIGLCLLLPLVALCAQGDQQILDPVSSASSFVDCLTKEQRDRAVLPFGGDYRTLWRYTPATRQGVSWKELDAEQTKVAHVFLRAFLSELGYRRSQDIRTIEQVLSGIENSSRRDKDYYVFTFFGEPSAEGRWGWRYEGHHISLNFMFEGNRLVSSTPQFFGSNPAEVRAGEHKGLRMLGREEDMGIAFYALLTESQKRKALLSSVAPNEIFTAENRTATRQEGGLPYTELDSAQRAALQELVRTNAESQQPKEVKRRMDAIEKDGWDKVVFAWMGAPDRSAGHYYRIQGKSFLIEFDNAQTGANHVHLVWRDFEGDFGRDVLREHYEKHKGDKAHGHSH